MERNALYYGDCLEWVAERKDEESTNPLLPILVTIDTQPVGAQESCEGASIVDAAMQLEDRRVDAELAGGRDVLLVVVQEQDSIRR